MNLNDGVAHLSSAISINMDDTALSLKCLEASQNQFCSDVSNCTDDGCRLVLGLGPTSASYYFSTGVNNKNKDSASGFTQGLGDSVLQLGLPAESIDTFSGLDGSFSTYTENTTPRVAISNGRQRVIPVVDEGSTSAKRSGGYMPSLLFDPNVRNPSQMQQLNHCGTRIHSQVSLESSPYKAFSVQQRTSNPRKCKFMGCVKGARGASGLCISHGGGQRCQKPGCNKGAESKTNFCKTHGGGKRCEHLGCTKSAEGKTDFCISHGGGRRCEFPEGCDKAARGKSGLCIKHGGGKRCFIESCTRSAEGQAGLCISHGGGKRCQFLSGCEKGAQGSTNYCKAHGGGKRCIFSGCSKGAEGSTPLCKAHGGGKRCLADGGGICSKSVHGGTNFCVAHGGGKRCAVVGCTKSARGRTDCCVKHGGGKRCKIVDCEKSAQGSTEFCKAHGGGKRCSWGGDEKCEKFARGKSGLCAAHNTIMSREKEDGSKSGLIGPGLFSGLVVGSASDHSQSGVSAVSECTVSVDRIQFEKRQKKNKKMMIPMQVLVPSSMKLKSPSNSHEGETNVFDFMVPEERVHGGGLIMSLLGGSIDRN
ncbi:putative WRKY transcription factor 19 [Cardamine amara subsp. amara]|uniref:WRKY transcription factor 19 n=1 Tax=Cardamine amara subsp. amara TaxID=228776 RepID=A0ABD1C4Y9_CARAN